MNGVDILLIVVLAAAIGGAVWRTVKRRKSGGCGCGCDGCTASRDCREKP